jgi:hypothetical protein
MMVLVWCEGPRRTYGHREGHLIGVQCYLAALPAEASARWGVIRRAGVRGIRLTLLGTMSGFQPVGHSSSSHRHCELCIVLTRHMVDLALHMGLGNCSVTLASSRLWLIVNRCTEQCRIGSQTSGPCLIKSANVLLLLGVPMLAHLLRRQLVSYARCHLSQSKGLSFCGSGWSRVPTLFAARLQTPALQQRARSLCFDRC